MNWLPGPETRAAVLKHPFVLAGVAVVALLGLLAGALVLVDSARGENADTPQVDVQPKTTQTLGPTAKTAIANGLLAKTKGVTAVRSAPGERTTVLGTLARGAEVQIDGRSSDSGWYRVIYPPNSEIHGWIDASLLDVTGDPEALVVATAEPGPQIDLPTAEPITITPLPPTPDGTTTPAVTGTPGAELADLVMGTTPTISNGKLFVTVVNQGTAAVTADLVVAIFNADSTALLGGATLPAFTLDAGRSIDIGTGYEVTSNQTLVLVVDPNGEVEESDNTNNRVTVAISVGDVPTPTIAVPFETPVTGQRATPPVRGR